MRILVISDTHGRQSVIEKAIEAQKEARHIFFLGDCLSDIEDLQYIYTDRIFHTVCGNCDYGSMQKAADLAVINGVKILFTHGHAYSVKGGLTRLKERALAEGATLALYGHTHVANIQYEDGVYFVNPGSPTCPREGRPGYAVVDIVEEGIMPVIINC
jgi:putative phosphoesterase